MIINLLRSVSISCETEGATIYFTTDGVTPTRSSSIYEGAIYLPDGVYTISAFAVKDGYEDSDINYI